MRRCALGNRHRWAGCEWGQRRLEQLILEKRLAHGNHPVLSMCAVVEGKDDANRKLSKNKSTGRIDGMIALAMAVGVAPLVKTVDVAALIG